MHSLENPCFRISGKQKRVTFLNLPCRNNQLKLRLCFLLVFSLVICVYTYFLKMIVLYESYSLLFNSVLCHGCYPVSLNSIRKHLKSRGCVMCHPVSVSAFILQPLRHRSFPDVQEELKQRRVENLY